MTYPRFPLEQRAVSSYDPLRGETVRILHLYVAPGAALADDANSGSQALPLATFDGLMRRLRLLDRVGSDAPLIVHLESAAYSWSVPLDDLKLRAPAVIVCDGAGQDGDDGTTVLRGPSAAAAGSTTSSVVDPDGGMTVNSLQGRTIQMLTGAAAGEFRTIRNNTATAIVPVYPFSAIAEGDSFRVFEPGAVITTPASANAGALGRHDPLISGIGTPADTQGTSGEQRQSWSPSTLLLVNLTFTDDNTSALQQWLSIASSAVALAGVLFRSTRAVGFWVIQNDETSQLIAGCDQPLPVSGFAEFVLPYQLGLLGVGGLFALCDSPTKWTGWAVGIVDDTQPVTFSPRRFSGFMVYQANFSGASGPITRSAQWVLYGGEFNSDVDGATVSSRVWHITDQSAVLILPASTSIPFRVIGTGSSNNAAAIEVTGSSRLASQDLTVELAGSGCGIAAAAAQSVADVWKEPGRVSLVRRNVIDAPRSLVVALLGGQVSWDEPPTTTVVPSVGEAVITQSSIGGAAVAPSPATFAGIADGVVVVNPDGSGTMLRRVT